MTVILDIFTTTFLYLKLHALLIENFIYFTDVHVLYEISTYAF